MSQIGKYSIVAGDLHPITGASKTMSKASLITDNPYVRI